MPEPVSVRTAPAPGEVHLWRGTAGGASPDDLLLLSAAERARAARLRGTAADCYVTAHAAMRRVLGAQLGTAPERVRLVRGRCPLCGRDRHGPPVVDEPGCGLAVSLSRSGPEWLLAVGAGHAVGVDLERERRVDVPALALVALSAAERRALLDCGHRAEGCSGCFLRCWTRKEAVVKASGAGVGADLRRVEVHPRRSGPVLVSHGTGRGGRVWWRVRTLAVGPGRHAALAVPADTPVRRTVQRSWPC